MIPTRRPVPARARVWLWVGTVCVAAVPAYLAFVAQRSGWWLLATVAILVLARVAVEFWPVGHDEAEQVQ